MREFSTDDGDVEVIYESRGQSDPWFWDFRLTRGKPRIIPAVRPRAEDTTKLDRPTGAEKTRD